MVHGELSAIPCEWRCSPRGDMRYSQWPRSHTSQVISTKTTMCNTTTTTTISVTTTTSAATDGLVTTIAHHRDRSVRSLEDAVQENEAAIITTVSQQVSGEAESGQMVQATGQDRAGTGSIAVTNASGSDRDAARVICPSGGGIRTAKCVTTDGHAIARAADKLDRSAQQGCTDQCQDAQERSRLDAPRGPSDGCYRIRQSPLEKDTCQHRELSPVCVQVA